MTANVQCHGFFLDLQQIKGGRQYCFFSKDRTGQIPPIRGNDRRDEPTKLGLERKGSDAAEDQADYKDGEPEADATEIASCVMDLNRLAGWKQSMQRKADWSPILCQSVVPGD
jgi:hypothetical protein